MTPQCPQFVDNVCQG